MSDRLNVPQELDALIEKRDTDERREGDRRQAQASAQPASDSQEFLERRATKDRRQGNGRRSED